MTLEEVSLTSTPGSDWSSPPLLTLTVVKLEPVASGRNLWKNVCANVSLTVYYMSDVYDLEVCSIPGASMIKFINRTNH